MDLGSLFQQVSGLLNNHTRQNDSVDTDGILGQVGNLFRQHGYDGQDYNAPHTGGYNGMPVLPASQDPMGDPADQQGYTQASYNNQSAADQQAGILPASADPMGDPADQPRR